MLALNEFLVRIYQFFHKRKYLLFLVLGLWGLACFSILKNIHFKEDINSVFPDDPEVQRANNILKNSPFINRIYVVVKQKKKNTQSSEKLMEVADLFEENLTRIGVDYFSEIKNKIDEEKTLNLIEMVRTNVPYFMNDSDYLFMDSLLQPERIHSTFEAGYNQLLSPAGFAFKNTFVKDPLGITWRGMSKLKKLNINKKFTVESGYLMSADEQNILILLEPKTTAGETGKNKELIKVIDKAIQQTMNAEPQFEVIYFGAPAVSVANARQIQKDVFLTVGLAFILLNILVFLYFRKWYSMPLLFTPVLFGTITGLTIITLIKGSISLIVLGIGAVMLELILDFAIHSYTHYNEHKDPREMIRSIAALLLATAGATTLSFFCLLTLKSNLLADLGLFAGVSIISAAIFTVIVFPHFLKKKPGLPFGINTDNAIKRPCLSRFKMSKRLSRVTVFIVVVIAVFSIFYAGKVTFDANIDKFSYVPRHLQEAENYLDEISDFKLKSVYLISEGTTFTEASKKNQQYILKLDSLKNAGIIDGYTSINQLWPDQSQRIILENKWKKFWTPEKITNLRLNIEKEAAIFKFKQHVFDGFINSIDSPALYSDEVAFAQMKELVFEDLIQENADGVKLISLVKIREENKPAFYSAFTKKDFVFDTKFIFNKLLAVLQQDFQLLSLLSSLLVFAVVLLTFRRFELSIAVMIPMMLGWFLTLGLMAILGIQLNIFNLIICTFIFGLGMDYSIFYGRGLLDKYRNDNVDQQSFKIAILLSLVTTMLGMGVLILAQHPALRSIGLVSMIGLFSIAMITFFLQPVIFKFILNEGDKPRRLPLTPITVFTTLVYLGCYIINAIFMFIITLFLVKTKIIPKGQKLLEKINAFMSRLVLSSAFVVKTNFRSIDWSVFDKSAIIIANHQSSIDIVIMAMLSGKIRIVTKQWVFKLPVIGFMARTLEFYPSERINEPAFIEKAKRDLAAGYFIMFFAEGTRSPDLNIQRFKKGAFLLAEQTGADILPILIHGTGVSMPSGTAFIGPGLMKLKILPRILHGDVSYQMDYSSRTKKVHSMMRSEFYQFRKETETHSFVKLALKPRYMYRSPEVRVAYKAILKHKAELSAIDQLIGENEKIGILNPNYGELASYLLFRSAARRISVVEQDYKKLLDIHFLKNWHPDLTIYSGLHELQDIENIIIQGLKTNMKIMEDLFSSQHIKKIILFAPEIRPQLPKNWKILNHNDPSNPQLFIVERDEAI